MSTPNSLHDDTHIIIFCLSRYRVFLGYSQYFVASDVGAGKMQWYAFHREPPGNTDPPSGMLTVLTYLLLEQVPKRFESTQLGQYSSQFNLICNV